VCYLAHELDDCCPLVKAKALRHFCERRNPGVGGKHMRMLSRYVL